MNPILWTHWIDNNLTEKLHKKQVRRVGGRLVLMTSNDPSPLRFRTTQALGTSVSQGPSMGEECARVPLLWLGPTLPCCFRHYSLSNLHAIKYSGHRKNVRKCSSVISKDRLHCLAFKIALPKWAFHNWASKFSFYSLFMYYATIKINYAPSSWEEIRFGCKLEERKRHTFQRQVTVSVSPPKAWIPSILRQISGGSPQLS